MTRDEYLAKLDERTSVTFIIAKSVNYEHGPGYTYTYRTTPIRAAWEWKGAGDYLVINADHPPLDISGHWVRRYNEGHLKCAILTTEEDLLLHYGPEQGQSMIEWYKKLDV